VGAAALSELAPVTVQSKSIGCMPSSKSCIGTQLRNCSLRPLR
jgi:hypothetical protein